MTSSIFKNENGFCLSLFVWLITLWKDVSVTLKIFMTFKINEFSVVIWGVSYVINLTVIVYSPTFVSCGVKYMMPFPWELKTENYLASSASIDFLNIQLFVHCYVGRTYVHKV